MLIVNHKESTDSLKFLIGFMYQAVLTAFTIFTVVKSVIYCTCLEKSIPKVTFVAKMRFLQQEKFFILYRYFKK